MNSKIVLELKQWTKQRLLCQLERCAILLSCDDISFYSKDVSKKCADEIDALVAAMINLTVHSVQQVNGIDTLVVEITLKLQEELVNLLNRNKHLTILQTNDELLIHSMTNDHKQTLARSNKDMCRKLLDLPIKALKRKPTTQNAKRTKRIPTSAQQAKKIITVEDDVGSLDEGGNEMKVELSDRNPEALIVDEVTFEFKIGDLQQIINEVRVRRNSSQFVCNEIPWILQFRKYKDDDDKTEISVSLFCDYKSKECKNWSIAVNFELILLSQVDGVADKREALKFIFKSSDDGMSFT